MCVPCARQPTPLLSSHLAAIQNQTADGFGVVQAHAMPTMTG